MAKADTSAKPVKKSPKTVKVSTLIIVVLVIAGMIASFIAGNIHANSYNDTVHAQAVELSKELKPRK